MQRVAAYSASSAILFCALLSAACSLTDTPGGGPEAGARATAGAPSVASGGGASDQPASSGGSAGTPLDLALAGSASALVAGAGPTVFPQGFVMADGGGWKLGEPITATTDLSSAAMRDGCQGIIRGVVRDFESDSLTFEAADEAHMGDDRNIVATQLGADQKPVYAHTGATKTIASPEVFNTFYNNVEGTNLPFVLSLYFAANGNVQSFDSHAFFPLDSAGFDAGLDTGHNFWFTTEIHTQFKYTGGETFSFTGDDDVWVFINHQRVIDLGGVHTPEAASVAVDSLGLTLGVVYAFDLFQSERHTEQSNFRADTTLNFIDCGTIIEVPK
jgi:fibro-slime domain-containing protein